VEPLHTRKVTKEERLLALLLDGEWHSAPELVQKVSHRFGGYLHTLKHDHGVEWEKMLDPNRPQGEVWYLYRLVPGQGRLFG